MSFDPKNVAALSSSEKRALLSQLLEKKSQTAKSFPLSFAQEAIWFFEQLQPGTCLYNMPAALRISGRLDLGVAERVANEITRRHEVIRAAFSDVGGRPLQTITPTLSLPITSVDLREYHGREQDEEMRRFIAAETQRPFALNRAPLLRVTLLRLDDGDVLLVTMHHIICDGWSLRVFIREAFALYEALVNGRPSPLPELPVQYTDFVLWQRQWMQGEMVDPHFEYWKERLADLPLLELPTDRPRPAIQSFRGETEQFIVPESLSDALKSLSRHEGVTLFMTLLAAFQTLLYRYTGLADMVVGTATAGRKRAEIEHLIGVFANALVLRTDMSGNPTFRELLQRVRAVCQDAYAHDEVPFEKLVEVLRPKRDLRWTPLFRVMFRVIPPLPPLQNSLLAVTPLEGESGATGFDLSLSIMDMGDLKGSFVYSKDLFEASTVRRMVGHFSLLLAAIVAQPDTRLLSLRCLGDDEARQLRKRRDLRNKTEPVTAVPEIEMRSNLTSDQLAIWTGQKLQPDAPLYNLGALITIWDKIDLKHFKSAFQTLVNSSEAMRTVFTERDGLPQRSIVPTLPYTMEYLDFSLVSNPDVEARDWARQRCRVSLDLATRPFDTVLIKLSEKKFVWYLCQHHITTDAWSVRLIFDAVAKFYKQSLDGELAETVQLPPFQQYVDYERQRRRSAAYSRAQSYWKKKIQDEMETIVFYGKSAVTEKTEVHRVVLELGVERSQNLRAAAARQRVSAKTTDVSLLNIFAAVLCTYLYHVSGKRRIAIGVPFHNRRTKAFKATIGLFVEVLPINVILDDDDSFSSLLKKVENEVFETLRHSPYAPNNNRQKKLYDAVLNYHNMSRSNYNGAPIEVEAIHTGHGTDAFALRVVDFSESGNLTLELDFHCDVFDEERRGWAVQHLLRVLDAFVGDPTQLLSQVSLLSADEKQRILVEFNHTRRAWPENLTIHRLFEIQAERTPDNIAIGCGGQRLTYRELNSQVNRLAHYLRKLDVGPDIVVGVCMERSIEMVVALLAVLKANGAYLPLDPEYPKQRLSFMLEDAQPRVLLTVQRMIQQFMETGRSRSQDGNLQLAIGNTPIRVVCLDDKWDASVERYESDPVSLVMSENLAYVIYTSGSTGRPKGVMIPHRAIYNHMRWLLETFPFDETDRVAQKTPFSFDASVWEIFAPLMSGAQLVLAQPGAHRDPGEIIKFVRDEKITILQVVPSLLRLLLERNMESCTSLRHVFCGGETLPAALHYRFSRQLSAQLHNLYGPTEAAIDATCFTCSHENSLGTVPIGRPISNMHAHVLDLHLQPVPIGVPGELYLGGKGLARGYFNSPELTAERFIPNPFSEEPGANLYKTGDIVRYLSDGNIEFLGRMDRQIKIRGFRIELEEVETVLGQHPAVREAAVAALEGDPEDSSAQGQTGKRLVAYVVPKEEQPIAPNELRGFLKEKVPDYMLPSAFILLKSLPLTTNGKVDRRALPAPHRARDFGIAYGAPRNPSEEILTGIWAEVLGVDRVGVHDNFFELGGHSLQGIQLVSKMSRAMQLDIPVKLLFLHPTVADFAQALSDNNVSAPDGAGEFSSKPLGREHSSKLMEALNAGPSAGFLKIEHRPLLSLHAAGTLAPVDAAALGYLPDSILKQTGLSREQVIHDFCNDVPVFSGVLETLLGRIGLIMLPIFGSGIYDDRANLTRLTIDALRIARQLGARTVSLTGLIPSATDYGCSIANAIAGRTDVPMITTGHATTAATVVLAIQRMAEEGGRDLTRERVGFLGLGSIGSACLRLMLRCLPHPAEIILCDVYNKHELLQEIRNEIISSFGFRGSVHISESQAEVAPQFYDSTLIVGATNVPDILNLARIKPGTMIVDDSGPHCFSLQQAIRRLQEQGDILFTTGGVLRLPRPINTLLYLPRVAAQFMNAKQTEILSNYNPNDVTGCVFSSLLSSRFDDLKPAVGLVHVDASARWHDMLQQLKLRAADLHCEGYVLPEASIRYFRQCFGGSRHPRALES